MSADDDSLDRPASLASDSNVRAVAQAPPRAVRLREGTVVDGTFVIGPELGAGAMGVVYSATDRALDRRVALKIHAIAGEDVRNSRMWREAKAMARLSHPNVITVHEVGVHAGRVYIAMELVQGETVRDWLAQERPWRDVVALFEQAAQGLAAAHRVGLVHRDFKPSNALVGADGRVRVADFGLARAAEDVRSAPVTVAVVDSERSPSLDERVTQTGAAVGTPAYMAPEQLDGGAADHRSDQYAFCVALHEALYGVRPFEGRSLEELSDAASAGRIATPPPGRSVPAWLRAVVVRGLEARPEDRFEDMDALLAALRSDPTRRRRVVLAAGAGTVLVAGLAGAVVVLAAQAPACADASQRLRGVWDEGRAGAVEASIRGAGVSYGADTWAEVQRGLTAYARAWAEAASAACVAGDGELSPTLREAQTICLADRQHALEALVGVLVEADADQVRSAAGAVAKLPSVAPCSDLEYLAAKVKPPADPGEAERVAGLRRDLEAARALERAGAFTRGLDRAQQATAIARESAYAPVLAEALLVVGRLANADGDYALAQQSLKEAYTVGLAADHDEVVADAATHLIYVVGHQLARHDAGLEWGLHAMAYSRRIGFADGREGTVLNNLGAVYQVRGEYDASLEHYRRALPIWEAAFGAEHLSLARLHHNIGAVQRFRGEYEAAVAAFKRSISIREAALGPDHPAVASPRMGLGNAFFQRGDRDAAVAQYRQALKIRERALGADHPDLAATLSNLGVFLDRRGDYEEALVHHRRALAIEERSVGKDHPSVATSVENIGNVHYARGDYEQAAEHYRRALAVREAALGPEHPHVAASLGNLGLTVEQLGELQEALQLHLRALAIKEKALQPNHREIARSLENVGNVLHLQGRHEEAFAYYERTRDARISALGPEHSEVADSYTNLGNIYEARGQWAQALEHHERALSITQAALGVEHPRVAIALFNLGETHLGRGEPAAAVAVLERAVALREQHETPAADLAEAQFVLAQALRGSGGPRARVGTLARAAAEGFGAAGQPARAAAVDAWLTP